MNDEARTFIDYASPHAWFMAASNLHEQATDLYLRRARSGITIRNDFGSKRSFKSVDIDKSVYLLGGFALENVIKAFLVYEHPEWISGGKLAKQLKSHTLRDLRDRSKLLPSKKALVWVLEEFQSGLDSWFRYPCALTMADTIDERELRVELWEKYQELMKVYGKSIIRLLRKPWKGPHGFAGSYTFNGTWFGYNAGPLPRSQPD